MAYVIEVNVDDGDKSSLISKFERFQAFMEAGLIPAWQEIAKRLHAKIIAATPIRTGQLVRSTSPRVIPMRVTSIASAISPKNGFNYAKIQHDGGKTRGLYHGYIRAKKYMTGPLWATAPEVPGVLDDEIARIIAICGLG